MSDEDTPTRHSYPPAATTTIHLDSVQSTPAGRPADGGVDSHPETSSSISDSPGIARPLTRASSYATANENDDGDAAYRPSGPSPRSSAASPGRVRNDAAADAREGDEAYSSAHEDSDSDAVPSTPTAAMTPAAQLRLSLARRLWSGVTQLRSRSRCALLFQGAFTIAQVAAFIVMLGLSAHQTCAKPLRVFIALHVIRVAIAYPVSFYIALAPPGRPPRGEEDTLESRQRREARRVVGNARLDARLRTASDFISLFSFVWFFLGNFWLYSGGLCRDTSPYLWYSSLAILIISYIRVAELVIIVLAVVFFLPLVILILRAFGGLEKKHEIGPLSKEEIAKLPTVYYVPAPESAEKPTTVAPAEGGHTEKASDVRREHISPSTSSHTSPFSDQTDEKVSPKPRRRQLLRLLFKRKREAQPAEAKSKSLKDTSNGVYVPTTIPLHPLPDNLSSCPICLSDYEPPPLLSTPPEERDKAMKDLEPLTLLPCGHTIHKDCLAPWLETSGRCPVCQKAVLGEEAGSGKKGRLRRRRNNGRRHRENNGSTAGNDVESGIAGEGDGERSTV